jgi:nucleoside-diphosphate-sugar epimerase
MNYIPGTNGATTGTQVALVTGGAGFIGSHVVDALLSRGFRVIVIDNLSTGKTENLAHQAGNDRLVFLEADICDGLFAATHNLPPAWKEVSVIIHLAAQTSVVRSVASPLLDARTNYLGTMQVVEYARVAGVSRIVFISSSAVYGDVGSVPVKESNPVSPLSPYGVHKLCGEVLLEYCRQALHVSAIAFRLFNVYGPRQDPASPYSGVISVFAKRVLADKPVVVYGDGTQSRDFVFVSDVVKAIADASTAPCIASGVFNIGTGRETTINSLARMIIELSGSSSPISYASGRPGELHRSLADISEASTNLRYRPQVSLREGLTETLAWFRQDRDLASACSIRRESPPSENATIR